MLKIGKSILWAASIGIIGTPLFAGVASGPVYIHGSYDSLSNAPNGSYVKFCAANVSGGINGTGQCYVTTTSNGSFSITLPNFQSYFFFTWYDPEDWGSASTRAWTNTNGQVGDLVNFATGAYMNIISELRPHRPTAIYPLNGATDVPLVFTLKWTSGIDVARNWPGVWPVTYDVYAYGEGGAELKVLSDIPCNPDIRGYCSYYINNVVPNWRYFWRVVPKIQVSYPTTRVYDQSSPQFTFVTQP
jgi:hypothetical protein